MPAKRRDGFRIVGFVREAETGRPLSNLIVRAFDRDLILDDKLGNAVTDGDGRFEIRYGLEHFRDLLEARPDLYLRVLDRAGVRVLHETSGATRRNASDSETYEIEIPARVLDPRRRSK